MASEAKPKSPPPWYREYDKWRPLAQSYIEAYWRLPDDAPHHAEFKAFSELSRMRLVFESNQIEGAGVSEGDTRKLVKECFPEVPSDYEVFRTLTNPSDVLLLDLERIDKMKRAIADNPTRRLVESFHFKGKSRSTLEVVRHYNALLKAEVWAFDHFFQKNFSVDVDVALLDGEQIKELHRAVATDLMPPDAGVEAGYYRVDSRSVGLDVSFTAWELLPIAMQSFVDRANNQISNTSDFIRTAADVTYDFLMIHPFPDFNGRISRLLLAMILRTAGVPFPFSLRGDRKSKHRYMTSLKRANRGDLRPYATLIARRLVESFQEIDANLARAGLSSVLAFLPNKKPA